MDEPKYTERGQITDEKQNFITLNKNEIEKPIKVDDVIVDNKHNEEGNGNDPAELKHKALVKEMSEKTD